jgi:uncharacterized protein YyaL (SSP411 family)
MPAYTNRLARETSPYLLQHAHNPVDWYPWGEEAFERARREDKPLLVSIGYAACHWCHVMERESFENPEVAALMNEHFVNIKVDREERPDVDGIYMDAVQAISGSGGWPLNVFLTPDGRPFYGGTYFPPTRAFNRAAWTDVLQAVADAYRNKKGEIESQAQTLTEHLKAANAFGGGDKAGFIPSREGIDEAFRNIMKSADRLWGGFGRAPKFPQTFVITFLLRYTHLTGNEDARDQALLSLDRMLMGGIYDHVGGGFARYSTDTEWLVPHFEKMLYDNALLVSTLAEAYQLTGEERYKDVIAQTLGWAERELQHPDGGFYSALDADSEGEEGKFYVWDYEEVAGLLGPDAELFCAYYDITPRGNWEGKNIPWVIKPLATFAREKGVGEEELKALLQQGRGRLLQERNKRVRPGLDDKILLSWNALMNVAYSKAYAATGEEAYRQTAERNMTFLLGQMGAGEGLFHHTWKGGVARHYGFLEDYSYLVAALIELGTITGDPKWLLQAKTIAETVLKHFKDDASPFFFFTPDFQGDVLLRKKEIYDGATPSGNSVMAYNLYQLSILLDRPEWKRASERLLASMGETILKFSTSFGVWLTLMQEMVYGTREIAVIGPEAKALSRDLLQLYNPHKVMMANASENDEWPLLRQKKVGAKTLIFLCENYACRQPVFTIGELQTLLQSHI